MNFFDCIDGHVKRRHITDADAKRLKDEWRKLRAKRAVNAEGSADQLARADLLETLEKEKAHKRRKAKLALDAAKRIQADAFSHKVNGLTNVGDAFLDMLEHFGSSTFSSVEGRRRAITGMAHAKMEAMLHHFRRGAVLGDKGRHNVPDLADVLREAFGTDTGNPRARVFANAWMETAEWLRQRFNAAGGAIGKLDNWGLPQHHDPRALRKAGLPAWKAAIKPLLDVAKMRHPLSGQAVDEGELDGILDEVWLTVATEGWSKRQPSRGPAGKGALANQRAEHRFLVFRDPQAWLSYQEDFGGGGDVFGTMMEHINAMAKDIAAMEVLGPNPDATIAWVKQIVEKEGQAIAAGSGTGRLGGAHQSNALDKAAGYNKRIDAVWGSIRGSLETPVNGRWANGLAAARSLITASVLGSAAISSISDVGTSMIARKFAGLPAKNAIPQIVKSFGSYTKREAVQTGLILDAAQNVFHAQARYVGTFSGPNWASFIADRVLTLSGLTPWTQAARHAFGLAFLTEAGNRAGLPLKDMPAALQATFRRYGVSDADWDKVRALPLKDGQLVDPRTIAERIDDRTAEKFLEMVQTETEYAVPNGSHRSRTALLDENRPGTFVGEVLRSFSQFKSFGAVFVLLHGGRVHRMWAGGDKLGGAAYAGSLLLSTTIFGAVALQLKQLAAGKETREADTPAFWTAALLQGGGLGIYGDFLFSNINRYGGGFSTTLAGPTIERANDFWNLTAGNAVQFLSGDKTHFGRELVKFARGNVPGSNIWYMRLAFERTVFDQMQYLADPEANKAFKRQQQFWRREFGQEFWWKPGALTPGGR